MFIKSFKKKKKTLPLLPHLKPEFPQSQMEECRPVVRTVSSALKFRLRVSKHSIIRWLVRKTAESVDAEQGTSSGALCSLTAPSSILPSSSVSKTGAEEHTETAPCLLPPCTMSISHTHSRIHRQNDGVKLPPYFDFSPRSQCLLNCSHLPLPPGALKQMRFSALFCP